MNSLSPTQTSNHGTRRTFHISSALDGTKHVFVRRDARAPPLTRPYIGPFRVVRSGPKYFELDIKGKVDKVSIDRLKNANLPSDHRQDSAELSKSVCYDEGNDSDWTNESRDREQIPSELNESISAQPLRRRGRPTRAEAKEKRAQERERYAESTKRENKNAKTTTAIFPQLPQDPGASANLPIISNLRSSRMGGICGVGHFPLLCSVGQFLFLVN